MTPRPKRAAVEPEAPAREPGSPAPVGEPGPTSSSPLLEREADARRLVPGPGERSERRQHGDTTPGRGRAQDPGGSELEGARLASAGSRAIAAAMTEDRGPNSLDAQVRTIVKGLGLLAYHTKDSRRSAKGYPDWTIVGKRGVLFRELKTQRGKVTREQQAWLDALSAAGQDACVWRPEDLLSGRMARELATIGGLRLASPERPGAA